MGILFRLLVPFFIGLFCLYYSAGLLRKRKKALENSMEAEGIVLAKEADDTGGIGVIYPVIQYTTQDGQAITKKAAFGTSFEIFRTGDKVKIVYDKNDPENFRIDFGINSTLYWISQIAGVAFILYGFYSLVWFILDLFKVFN